MSYKSFYLYKLRLCILEFVASLPNVLRVGRYTYVLLREIP